MDEQEVLTGVQEHVLAGEAALPAYDAHHSSAIGRDGFAPAEQVSQATWKRGIKVWGLIGGPFLVHSLQELLELFESKKHAVARYVYTYTWVPTAKHAPWFPFIILASDNKFTGTPSCTLQQ